MKSKKQLNADEEIRNMIIRCSKELLRDHDFEDVTVNDICKASNISIGKFYRFFKAKEDLIDIYHMEFDQYVEGIGEYLESLSPIDSLLEFVKLEMEYIKKNLSYNTLLFSIRLNQKTPYFNLKNRSFFYQLKRISGRILEQYPVRPGITPDRFAEQIVRVTRGSIAYWCSHTENDLTECALEDIRSILFGNLVHDQPPK